MRWLKNNPKFLVGIAFYAFIGWGFLVISVIVGLEIVSLVQSFLGG